MQTTCLLEKQLKSTDDVIRQKIKEVCNYNGWVGNVAKAKGNNGVKYMCLFKGVCGIAKRIHKSNHQKIKIDNKYTTIFCIDQQYKNEDCGKPGYFT